MRYLSRDFPDRNGSSSTPVQATPIANGDVKDKVRQAYEKIKDSKQSLLVDENFDVIKKVSAKEVGKNIKLSRKKIFAIILDGAATASIVKSCEEEGIQHLAATTFSGIDNTSVNLISL
jgi:hypothetical protein